MTIAVLGMGIMGAAMARNWLAAGKEVRVWNRSPERSAPLGEAGATVAPSPVEAVRDAEVVVTMLYDEESVAATIEAAAAGLHAGQIWLQMSTVGSPGADRLGELAARHGLRYVDAPVLGTRGPAEQGKLTILASGPEDARDVVGELSGPISGRLIWLGEAGAGSRAKLVVNAWVMAAMAGIGQAIALAEGLDVDPKLFLELIAGGPLDIAYAHVKGAAMMDRSYDPAFPISGAIKDSHLISEVAHSVGVDASTVENAGALFERAAALGHRDADIAAIVEAFRPQS